MIRIIYVRTKLGPNTTLVMQPRAKFGFHSKQKKKNWLRYQDLEFCFHLLTKIFIISQVEIDIWFSFSLIDAGLS